MAGQIDDGVPGNSQVRQMQDELEQLRTALESALEENAQLAQDRDRLLQRVAALSRELQMFQAGQRREPPPPPTRVEIAAGEQEEQLRIAFEELQVLTEELEVANTTLQQANEELDAKIDERTQELVRTNAALVATDFSLRAITDLVPDLLWRAGSDGAVDWFNHRWFEYTGADISKATVETWSEFLHPLDRAAVEGGWRQSIATGRPFQSEHRIRDAQGNYRWFLCRAEPMRDGDGRIVGWYAAGTDVHDQRTVMTALQQSELRFRTLIEGMPQLVWRAVDHGQWTWSSPQWTEYTGQPGEASTARGWLEMFHPDDRTAVIEAWDRAEEAGQLEFEARLFHAGENRYRHFHTRALPVRDASERTLEWLGTSTDVDDIIQLQKRQSILVGELQHRTRNLLAVVQALVRRTIQDSTSMPAFRECFEDRLMALGRVQGLLSRREAGARVPFDKVLLGELAAHVSLDDAGNGRQVSTEGPPGVPLKSATVQTLALALHELTTNAVKYGALAQEDGRLHVAWKVLTSESGSERLFVDWRESGVTRVPGDDAPARGGGYGRELIEQALPHQLAAETTYTFGADGVHCTIEVDIPVNDSPKESMHV